MIGYMKKIRWGIFGTGAIAHTFADSLSKCENAELCVISSRSEEKAKAFAAEYGFKKAYGSYELLAADPEVDIVYIATPMSSHYDDAMLCLRRGKNVFCEKSVTLNYRQLDDILTLAREKRLFFMEAMWLKCRPSYLKAKEWVQSGKIGKPKAVKAEFCSKVPVDMNSRLFRPDCGGGALLDLAVYPLTLAADFLGNYPCDITSSAVMGDIGVDLTDLIHLTYADGSHASVSASFQIGSDNSASVIGTDGFIQFDNGFVWSCGVTLYDKNGVKTDRFEYENDINGYEYEIREAMRCLSEGLTESPLVKQCDTEAVMKIMDSCREQWGFTYPEE